MTRPTRLIDADALYMELVKMNDFGELTAKKAIRVVKNAPTIDIEPQWIPVSEGLPQEEEKVLIFQTYDRNCNVTIGYIKGKECFDNGSYNGGYWEWFIIDKNSKSMCRTACPGDEYVKGWMPLPKPYEVKE